MTTQARRPGWALWLLWTCMCVLGWVAGVALTGEQGNFLGWLLAGALLGLLQGGLLTWARPGESYGGLIVATALGVVGGAFLESDRQVSLAAPAVYGEPALVGGHVDDVVSIAVTADGSRVLTGSTDGTAILWDLETGAEIRTYVDHDGPGHTNPVAISPDGATILTGGGRTPDDRDRGHGYATLRDLDGRAQATFAGEGYYIDALAFSPDGAKVVTCGGGARGLMEGVVKLWDLSTGELIRSMEGFPIGAASAVAFSPDGSSILVGSGGAIVGVSYPGDSMAILWDVETGERIQTFAHGPRLNEEGTRKLNTAVNAVAFLPDGKAVVTAGGDEVARFFDVATGEELRTMPYDAFWSSVARLAVSPDGARIALPDGEGSVSVRDIDTGAEIHRFEGHGSIVTSLAYTPSGSRLLVGSSDDTVGVWNVDSGRRVRTLGGNAAPSGSPVAPIWSGRHFGVHDIAFAPGGETILSAGGDSRVRFRDAVSGRAGRALEGHGRVSEPVSGGFRMPAPHEGGVYAVDWSPDGTKLLTGGWPHAVKLWDVTTGAEIRSFEGLKGDATDVAFSPDGTAILGVDGDRLIVWNAASGERVFIQAGAAGSRRRAVFSPDGTRILSAGTSSRATMWDSATGEDLMVLVGHDDEFTSIAFAPDGTRAITGSRDRTAIVWDLADGRVVRRFDVGDHAVRAIAFSPDGRLIATGSDAPVGMSSGIARLWDAETGALLRTIARVDGTQGGSRFRGSVRTLAFSPDGVTLVTGSSHGSIRAWDATTGVQHLVRSIPLSWGAVGALLGVLVGVLQWWFLRRAFTDGWWWILGTGTAWCAGALVTGTMLDPATGVGGTAPRFLTWTAGGVVVGALSGGVLIWRLRRSAGEAD